MKLPRKIDPPRTSPRKKLSLALYSAKFALYHAWLARKEATRRREIKEDPNKVYWIRRYSETARQNASSARYFRNQAIRHLFDAAREETK